MDQTGGLEQCGQMIGLLVIPLVCPPPIEKCLEETTELGRRLGFLFVLRVVEVEHQQHAVRFGGCFHPGEGHRRIGDPLEHARGCHDVESPMAVQARRLPNLKLQIRKRAARAPRKLQTQRIAIDANYSVSGIRIAS